MFCILNHETNKLVVIGIVLKKYLQELITIKAHNVSNVFNVLPSSRVTKTLLRFQPKRISVFFLISKSVIIFKFA